MRRGAADFVGPMNSTMLPSGSLTKTWRKPGRPRDDVAAGQPQLRDLTRGRVGVLGPQGEVRVARQDLFPLDRRAHELVVQDDVQRQAVAEAVPDAGEVEGRPRDLLEPQRARVEIPRLGDVGDGDADVIQLLEQAHGDLLMSTS